MDGGERLYERMYNFMSGEVANLVWYLQRTPVSQEETLEALTKLQRDAKEIFLGGDFTNSEK